MTMGLFIIELQVGYNSICESSRPSISPNVSCLVLKRAFVDYLKDSLDDSAGQNLMLLVLLQDLIAFSAECNSTCLDCSKDFGPS